MKSLLVLVMVLLLSGCDRSVSRGYDATSVQVGDICVTNTGQFAVKFATDRRNGHHALVSSTGNTFTVMARNYDQFCNN